MADRPILRHPDPRLRQACAPVTVFDESLRQLAHDLCDAMKKVRGAGLTANQVGESVDLFVIDAGVAAGSVPLVFCNTLVEPVGDGEPDSDPPSELDDEGCLSFPGVFVPVRRYCRVRASSHDLSGRPFELEAGGMLARALQHEADHLEGRLLIDVVGPVTRKIILAKLRKLDKHR